MDTQQQFAAIALNPGLHEAKEAVQAGFEAREASTKYSHVVEVRTLTAARGAVRAAAAFSRAILVEACGTWEDVEGNVVDLGNGVPLVHVGSIWVTALTDADTIGSLRPAQTSGANARLRISWNVSIEA